MKIFTTLATVLAVIFGLRYVAQRGASHQRMLPRFLSVMNTQVHRINQSGPDRIFSPMTESAPR